MSEQIVVSLDDDHELSKSEWKEFVRSQRGKWRGVASDEAVKALRQYMESQVGQTDDEKERLRSENERLHAENERLHEEVERLREQVNRGASPGGTSSEISEGTKKNGSEQTKIAAPDEQADSSTDDVADEAERDYWAAYDPTATDESVPEAAVKQLADRDVEDIPGIRREHVDVPESVPYKPKEAKRALLIAVLRGEYETVTEGEILDLSADLFSKNASSKDELTDQHHYRQEWVEPVTDSLPVHPDPAVDAWVTTDEAHERLAEEQAEEAESEAERFVERHVRAALADPRVMQEIGGQRAVSGMTEQWDELREGVEGEQIHGMAANIVEKAIRELEGPTSMESSSLPETDDEWPSFREEWPSSADELVAWYDDEYDMDFADDYRAEVAASLAEYVPDGEIPTPSELDDEGADEEAEGWEDVSV